MPRSDDNQLKPDFIGDWKSVVHIKSRDNQPTNVASRIHCTLICNINHRPSNPPLSSGDVHCKMSAQATFRIMKELKEFHDHPDTNLYVPILPSHEKKLIGQKVHYDEANVTKFNALLVGAEDTPYEYGMFEFLLSFPNGIDSFTYAGVDLHRLSIKSTTVFNCCVRQLLIL